MAKGSKESLAFLEINYAGGNKNDKPVVLVGKWMLITESLSNLPLLCLFVWYSIGKGVTFDSGGISIKPSSAMGEMRADMMGAANVVSAISAIAELKLPINVIGELYKNFKY